MTSPAVRLLFLTGCTTSAKDYIGRRLEMNYFQFSTSRLRRLEVSTSLQQSSTHEFSSLATSYQDRTHDDREACRPSAGRSPCLHHNHVATPSNACLITVLAVGRCLSVCPSHSLCLSTRTTPTHTDVVIRLFFSSHSTPSFPVLARRVSSRSRRVGCCCCWSVSLNNDNRRHDWIHRQPIIRHRRRCVTRSRPPDQPAFIHLSSP